MIYQGDCFDMLDSIPNVPLIFADPPDNLGLSYAGYEDKRPSEDYYNWLELLIRKSLVKADCFWLSYYWEHDLEIKYRIRNILKHERRSVKAKTFIWRYTFGQYRDSDCASGFRFLLRLHKPSAKFRPDSIRIPSRRMALGDSRASGPRVPDDVWEYPRVVGNASERRTWHPTQHPEDLIRRIILFHTDQNDLVVDCFGGTGTTLRVARSVDRRALISEISPTYCQKIQGDNPSAPIIYDATTLVTLC